MAMNGDCHSVVPGQKNRLDATPAPPIATSSVRILVVDDVSANREVLSRRLAKRGYSVVEAEGGIRALELIERQDFDAILLDILMPDVSGLDVLRRTRKFRSRIELPIVMVSALAHSEDVVECLNAGANDYVIKPVDFDILLARLQPHVDRRLDSVREVDARRQVKQDAANILARCEQLLQSAQTLIQTANSLSELEEASNGFLGGYEAVDSAGGRTEPRRVFKAAKIVFNGRNSVIDCIVWKQSNSGAVLRAESESGIPDEFELALGDSSPVDCLVTRRALDEIEVRFRGRIANQNRQ